jgi:uncharacterized RDD family membrane protein YckC
MRKGSKENRHLREPTFGVFDFLAEPLLPFLITLWVYLLSSNMAFGDGIVSPFLQSLTPNSAMMKRVTYTLTSALVVSVLVKKKPNQKED